MSHLESVSEFRTASPAASSGGLELRCYLVGGLDAQDVLEELRRSRALLGRPGEPLVDLGEEHLPALGTSTTHHHERPIAPAAVAPALVAAVAPALVPLAPGLVAAVAPDLMPVSWPRWLPVSRPRWIHLRRVDPDLPAAASATTRPTGSRSRRQVDPT